MTREDIDERIRHRRARIQRFREKMRKEFEEHDGMNGLAEQILLGKTLDFLKANVSVEADSARRLRPTDFQNKT